MHTQKWYMGVYSRFSELMPPPPPPPRFGTNVLHNGGGGGERVYSEFHVIAAPRFGMNVVYKRVGVHSEFYRLAAKITYNEERVAPQRVVLSRNKKQCPPNECKSDSVSKRPISP